MELQQIVNYFHSGPQLDGVDPSLQRVLKFLPPSSETPKLKVATNGLYVDMTELPETVDFSKAIADCDILKEIITHSGPQIKRGMRLFKNSGKESDEELALEAVRICNEIGLSEKNFSAKGGGFIVLLIIILFATGCATCTQGGTYPPPQHPKHPK